MKYQKTRLTLTLYQIQQWAFFDIFGPKIMCIRTNVNFFKCLTSLWILSLMDYFNNWSKGMWLYLFLHGSYGIAWLIKDRLFPDSQTLKKASLGSHLVLTIVLLFYWMIPMPLALGWGINSPSILRVTTITFLYVLGLVLMMGSDYQKYKTLKMRKGLISTGFFKYSRNPNYLGQLLIYISFCLCSGHFLAFFAFALPAVPLFSLNIYLKEVMSYKAKPGYEQYRKSSNLFLIKVFQNNLFNMLFYLVIVVLSVWFFSLQSPLTFWYPIHQIYLIL